LGEGFDLNYKSPATGRGDGPGYYFLSLEDPAALSA
jgi:hypothetical protein